MRQSPSVREVPGFGRAALVWMLAEPRRCAASSVLGGGIGDRTWIANINVSLGYDHCDPGTHASELGSALGCSGLGCCLLTAVDVRQFTAGEDESVEAFATVGLGAVTWAADANGKWTAYQPGTINCVVFVPAPLTDGALVNLVSTVTEAKVQALIECQSPGTGTASDAIVVCAAAGRTTDASQWYGGPRSFWGARVARAVRRAVLDGVRAQWGLPCQ